jgi:hypothetical protein
MSYKNIVMDRRFHSIPEGSFEKAETIIGIKFPYPLYELIKNNDEGCPKDHSIKLIFPGETEYGMNGLHAFLSFNPRNMSNIVGAYLYKPEHQPQDERFVPFAQTGDGDKFFFFYETGKDDSQPKVYYWAHEYCDIDGGLVFLANSFEEFLDMLKPREYYDSL